MADMNVKAVCPQCGETIETEIGPDVWDYVVETCPTCSTRLGIGLSVDVWAPIRPAGSGRWRSHFPSHG